MSTCISLIKYTNGEKNQGRFTLPIVSNHTKPQQAHSKEVKYTEFSNVINSECNEQLSKKC